MESLLLAYPPKFIELSKLAKSQSSFLEFHHEQQHV
jgi:hypothetical protein